MCASFIMTELNKKRQQIRRELRRQSQRAYFQTIRQQLIHKQQLQGYLCETEQLLILAYIKSETQSADLFNIYANVEHQLHDILTDCSGLDFISELAIQLYVQLTSSATVLDYLLQRQPSQQWNLLQLLLTKFNKYQEYIYDRMRVFLERISMSQKLNPYHTQSQQTYSYQLLLIFSTATTRKIADLPIPIDDQSQYYDFVSVYVSLMPTAHIHHLFTQGFPQLFIDCPNNSVLLTFLGRLQVLRQKDQLFQQQFINLCDLLNHKHEINENRCCS